LAALFLFAAAGVQLALAADITAEQRAAQELERVRTNPLELRDFLKRMPKGADLHNHLNGAIYAETFIRAGGEGRTLRRSCRAAMGARAALFRLRGGLLNL
jgi:adenosine deaminase